MDITYIKTTESNLNSVPIIDGQLIYASDSGKQYSDFNGSRKRDVFGNEIDAMNENGCCNIWNVENKVHRGVTFTNNGENGVSVVGTASPNEAFDQWTLMLPMGTYKVSGMNGSGSKVKFKYNHPDGALFNVPADGIINDYIGSIILWVDGGETVDEVVYPMLYDARLNPTGYVPYAMTNKELTERTERSVEYSGALDNLLKPGFYITATGVTNTPNDSDSHFINNGLFVSGNGVNYCSQMIIDTRNQLYSRICNNGTWTTWEGYTKA